MMRPLLLALVLGGLLTGCSKSKPRGTMAAPNPPTLPAHLANPPMPDQVARQIRVPPGTPTLPKDIQMPPRPDLSELPPPPKDFVLPPLPPGVKWPKEIEQSR